MATKDIFGRETLEVLQFELDFLEQGGYGRSVRTPWLPRAVFVDSPSCLNFDLPTRPHACGDCILTQFVPEDRRTAQIPCHHIPLNEAGDTVSKLFADEAKTQDAVREWLKKTVARLRSEQPAQAAPQDLQHDLWFSET